MDSKTFGGNIGELKVAAKLAEVGYHIFVPIGGKSSIDLIAVKDTKVLKVQVKSVSKKNKYGTFSVQLKSVRSNKTSNKITTFKGNSCDILAVYLIPIDQVLFYSAKELDGMSCLAVLGIDRIKPINLESTEQGSNSP